MKKRIQYIFNPIFLIGLIILIVNDHILKEMFANWFTGKLSDFAGMLILPFILMFLFGLRRLNALFLSILFFSFWKSPLSQAIIDSVNQYTGLHFYRVVDFSDLLALLILPLSYWAIDHIDSFRWNLKRKKIEKWSQATLMCVAVFALFATSQDINPEFTSIESCCMNDPIETSVGNGNIFIPTIFTPDGNGMNDFFQIAADSNITKIDTFIVVNPADGQNVFFRTDIDQIIPSTGYDGNVLGIIQPTTFEYYIRVRAKNGETKAFDGIVCSVPCLEEMMINQPESYNHCAFSDQHDFEQGYDPNLVPQEIQDCF